MVAGGTMATQAQKWSQSINIHHHNYLQPLTFHSHSPGVGDANRLL